VLRGEDMYFPSPSSFQFFGFHVIAKGITMKKTMTGRSPARRIEFLNHISGSSKDLNSFLNGLGIGGGF
jgi:hypothetical protein